MYDWNGNGSEDPGDYVFDKMYQDSGASGSGRGSSRNYSKQRNVSWGICFAAACVIELAGCLILIAMGFDIADADFESLVILAVLTVVLKCIADSENSTHK
jgi:hypothetical protein